MKFNQFEVNRDGDSITIIQDNTCECKENADVINITLAHLDSFIEALRMAKGE
jgi:hypothetical protein